MPECAGVSGKVSNSVCVCVEGGRGGGGEGKEGRGGEGRGGDTP